MNVIYNMVLTADEAQAKNWVVEIVTAIVVATSIPVTELSGPLLIV